jgi:hypothetical protein
VLGVLAYRIRRDMIGPLLEGVRLDTCVGFLIGVPLGVLIAVVGWLIYRAGL